MVAHEVVGGSVTQRIVEFGRALQVGEHDGDPADLGVVAWTKQLLGGQSRRKTGMAITRSPVSASWAQLRFSTTKTHGLSLSLRITNSSLPFAPSSRMSRPRATSVGMTPSAPISRSTSAPASTVRKRYGPGAKERSKVLADCAATSP